MAHSNDIARLRAFNRFYTARIGVLLERPYDDAFSLAETRVLFELANAEELQPKTLAHELGLDPAYLSRILARFSRLKLIERRTDPDDRRGTRVKLTAKGRAAFAPMNQASNAQVAALLDPLSPGKRRDLVAAAAKVQRLLGAEAAGPVTLRDLAPGDIGWVTHRQAVLYHQEYGWDASYEALVAEILGQFVRDFDPKREQAWIAERDGDILGSIFLVKGKVPEVAKLRLLYVEPSARGGGIGAKLVTACIDGARARGYRRMTLWTNDVLVSARRIYEAAGFTLTKEERHHSFGKDLVGQTWTLDL